MIFRSTDARLWPLPAGVMWPFHPHIRHLWYVGLFACRGRCHSHYGDHGKRGGYNRGGFEHYISISFPIISLWYITVYGLILYFFYRRIRFTGEPPWRTGYTWMCGTKPIFKRWPSHLLPQLHRTWKIKTLSVIILKIFLQKCLV